MKIREGGDMKTNVYIGQGGNRKLVEAEIVGETERRLWVRLEDGNVISRRKGRDLPQHSSKLLDDIEKAVVGDIMGKEILYNG
jgi:hypothetical protein